MNQHDGPDRPLRGQVDEPYDVIVVGARPAGAATAMLLARRGRRVLVVDRMARGSDTRSTHALMRVGVHQLQRWGLVEPLRAAGTPDVPHVTFHYGDETEVVAVTPTAEVPTLLAPRRTVLDPVLADAATAAGADVRFGVRVTSLVQEPDGTVVGLRGRTGDDVGFEARARIVVGADGAGSMVAREVGADVVAANRWGAAFAHAYFAPDPSGSGFPGYEWCYRPGVAAGVIPTNDGVVAWVGGPPDRLRADLRDDTEGGFWSLLAEASPTVHARLRTATRTSRFQLHPGQASFLRRAHGRGWALVGDASHFVDPISAHGISDALRDAELLARAIDGGLAAPATLPTQLARYERQRDALSHPLMAAVDPVASFAWDLPGVRAHLLAMSDAMRDQLRAMRSILADEPPDLTDVGPPPLNPPWTSPVASIV